MTCTKEQLIQGIQTFINEDILPGIKDKPIQMALYILSQMPNSIATVLDKPVVQMFIPVKDGMYDMESTFAALTGAMDRYGSLPLTINPIPLINPSAVTISLTRQDVESLMHHVERVVNSNGTTAFN